MGRLGKTYAAVPLFQKFKIFAIVGDAAINLDGFTLSADAYVIVGGTAGITISPVTLSSTGSLVVAGDSSITLSAFTLASTLSAIVAGDGSITFDIFTLSSDGSLLVQGDSSVTLSPFTLSSIGGPIIIGESSNTLGAFTLLADGSLLVTGNASNTLGSFTLSAGSSSIVTGNADIDLGVFVLTAHGYRVIKIRTHAHDRGFKFVDERSNPFLDLNASGAVFAKNLGDVQGTLQNDDTTSMIKITSKDLTRVAENSAVTVEDGNTSDLTTIGNYSLIFIINKTDSTYGMYSVMDTVITQVQGDSSFVGGVPSAGEIGVYNSSGVIIVENNMGHNIDISRVQIL